MLKCELETELSSVTYCYYGLVLIFLI